MFDELNLSLGLKEVVLLAYIEAKLERRKELAAEQLLLIFLEDPEILRILTKFNINSRTLRTELGNHLSANEPVLDGDSEIEPEVATSLTRIFRQAHTLRFFISGESEPLSTTDILLSLIADNETVAARLLASREVTLNKLLWLLKFGLNSTRF